MRICKSEPADLNVIFELFDEAIAYQKEKAYELWPVFERDLILNEINEGRHWKILRENEIACVFSVLYHDRLIWGDLDQNDAVYLHRICTSKKFKGQNLIVHVRDWAIQHARGKGKRFVRMDTWGKNENMRNYYLKHGFNYLGQTNIQQPDGAVPHYGGSELSLLQIEVSQDKIHFS